MPPAAPPLPQGYISISVALTQRGDSTASSPAPHRAGPHTPRTVAPDKTRGANHKAEISSIPHPSIHRDVFTDLLINADFGTSLHENTVHNIFNCWMIHALFIILPNITYST